MDSPAGCCDMQYSVGVTVYRDHLGTGISGSFGMPKEPLIPVPKWLEAEIVLVNA